MNKICSKLETRFVISNFGKFTTNKELGKVSHFAGCRNGVFSDFLEQGTDEKKEMKELERLQFLHLSMLGNVFRFARC